MGRPMLRFVAALKTEKKKKRIHGTFKFSPYVWKFIV